MLNKILAAVLFFFTTVSAETTGEVQSSSFDPVWIIGALTILGGGAVWYFGPRKVEWFTRIYFGLFVFWITFSLSAQLGYIEDSLGFWVTLFLSLGFGASTLAQLPEEAAAYHLAICGAAGAFAGIVLISMIAALTTWSAPWFFWTILILGMVGLGVIPFGM